MEQQQIAPNNPKRDTASARVAEFGQRQQGAGEGGSDREARGMKRMQNMQLNDRSGYHGSSDEKPILNKFVQVWILEGGKKLKSIRVNTGISDNRFVELISGELKENDEVIVGTLTNGLTSNFRQMSPFGGPMMGGGPRR